MTKVEIDRVVLAVHQGYKEMNEDLKSEVAVWLLENCGNYPSTTSVNYIVNKAVAAVTGKTASSQDAFDKMIRRESKGNE